MARSHGVMVKLERFTAVLLILRDDAPKLDERAAAELQDAHLSHLADLHEAGYLLAAGPLLDPTFRGLSLFRVEPDRARELAERDPAVRAGRFRLQIIPWMVPAGAMTFARTHLPRAASEVSEE